MRKRAQFALAALLLAITGLIVWQVVRLREPVYQGKRLSVWLRQYSADADSPETDEALRAIGTNAIPILLAELQAREPRLKVSLPMLGLYYIPAENRHVWGQKGFSALGNDASNAASPLMRIYERDISPSSRHAAANALVEIGPAASISIPVLIKSAGSTNAEVRAFAVYTVGRMAVEPKVVDPVLIKSLRDPDREVRYNAAFGLGALAFMGGDAKPAVPALVETLNDSYPTARAAAAMALGHIHAQPDVVVPALITALQDSQVFVRGQASSALGEFGTNAKPAWAALMQAVKEENQDARNAAAKALKAIDPEAAAKAGVK
jgi:hypothetical protein